MKKKWNWNFLCAVLSVSPSFFSYLISSSLFFFSSLSFPSQFSSILHKCEMISILCFVLYSSRINVVFFCHILCLLHSRSSSARRFSQWFGGVEGKSRFWGLMRILEFSIKISNIHLDNGKLKNWKWSWATPVHMRHHLTIIVWSNMNSREKKHV